VRTAALGFASGAIHMAAIWSYYAALKNGEASETLAVMGGFTPLATALIAIPFLPAGLGGESLLAFALMVIGGFAMLSAEAMDWRRVLPSILVAAVLFGFTNVLQKVVFNRTGFVTGYVYFTMGTFCGAMSLLARPRWRREIFRRSEEAPPKSRLWYFVNRFLSGVGSFLIFVAISRTNPAMVSAIEGVRYAIVFIGAYAITRLRPQWLREDFDRRALIGKTIATALIVAGLVLAGVTGTPAS
jgi:uncharacterized membrane protein